MCWVGLGWFKPFGAATPAPCRTLLVDCEVRMGDLLANDAPPAVDDADTPMLLFLNSLADSLLLKTLVAAAAVPKVGVFLLAFAAAANAAVARLRLAVVAALSAKMVRLRSARRSRRPFSRT